MKDLEYFQRMGNGVTYDPDIKQTIKQEAVKWVKFQEDIQLHNPAYTDEYRLNIVWIKNFFNLTEEDLK